MGAGAGIARQVAVPESDCAGGRTSRDNRRLIARPARGAAPLARNGNLMNPISKAALAVLLAWLALFPTAQAADLSDLLPVDEANDYASPARESCPVE